MRLPLYCNSCDMLTGHESISIISARCRKCGNVRKIPLHRWAILFVLVIVALLFMVWSVWSLVQSIL